MNPGATMRPDASITVVPLSRERSPTLKIRVPRTPTSARYAARPVPSSTDPPRTMTSYGALRGGGAIAGVDGAAHAAMMATVAAKNSGRVVRTLGIRAGDE